MRSIPLSELMTTPVDLPSIKISRHYFNLIQFNSIQFNSSMLEQLKRKRLEQTVMGHRIEEPRLTLWAAFWALVCVGLPVAAVGLILDVLIQWATGRCLGLWCYF
jgi:hypothetical protein